MKTAPSAVGRAGRGGGRLRAHRGRQRREPFLRARPDRERDEGVRASAAFPATNHELEQNVLLLPGRPKSSAPSAFSALESRACPKPSSRPPCPDFLRRAAARSAMSTTSATVSSSSRPIASPRSTACSRPGSPRRGRSSRSSRTSGSAASPTSCRTTSSRPRSLAISRGRGGARAPPLGPRASSRRSARSSRSNAWRAATSRARAGRSTARPAPSAASRSRRASARRTAFPRPSSRPRRRPSPDTTSTSPSRLWRRPPERELAARLRTVTLELYGRAAAYAAGRGIVLADTKFEFGLDASGRLVWIDEALTPDSSRFWPADTWRPGGSPPSFDKQFVRDFLEKTGWNKTPPAPVLPPDVVAGTRARYAEAYERLTGLPFRA